LLDDLRLHVGIGDELTGAARARDAALTHYGEALDALTKRVSATWDANARLVSAGGAGSARRSFAELELAIGPLRAAFNGYLINGGKDEAARMHRAQRNFNRALGTHRSELVASPGRAWVDLVDED